MPQMAPLNWLVLFMFFSLIFIVYNNMNYFTFIYETKKEAVKKASYSFNWKW